MRIKDTPEGIDAITRKVDSLSGKHAKRRFERLQSQIWKAYLAVPDPSKSNLLDVYLYVGLVADSDYTVIPDLYFYRDSLYLKE